MGQYEQSPDIVRWLQTLQGRVAALERNTQQFSVPQARISRSTNFSASTTNQQFPFTDVDFDTARMRDSGTPEVLTVPYDGVYLVTATVTWNSISTGGMRAAQVRVNGASGPGGVCVPAETSTITKTDPVAVLPLEAGDELDLWVQHGDSINVNMQGGFTTLAAVWQGAG